MKQTLNFMASLFMKKKYIKVKVREFDGSIKTNFLGNGVPKENMHYTCIACITIDSVMKIIKKNYPQVYLEEYKYKIKKIQMSRFINAELELDSDSDLDSDSKELTTNQNLIMILNKTFTLNKLCANG